MLQRWITTVTGDMAQRLGYDQDQQEVLQYALTILITTINGLIAIGVFGLLVGIPLIAVVCGLSGGLLRAYSGGAHATSPGRCVAIGTIAYVGLGLIAVAIVPFVSIYILLPVTVIWAWWTIYRYAPAEAPGKPIQSLLHKTRLRKRAYGMLVSWTTLTFGLTLSNVEWKELIVGSCLGVLWQSLTLTPLGYRLIKYLDCSFEIMMKGNKI